MNHFYTYQAFFSSNNCRFWPTFYLGNRWKNASKNHKRVKWTFFWPFCATAMVLRTFRQSKITITWLGLNSWLAHFISINSRHWFSSAEPRASLLKELINDKLVINLFLLSNFDTDRNIDGFFINNYTFLSITSLLPSSTVCSTLYPVSEVCCKTAETKVHFCSVVNKFKTMRSLFHALNLKTPEVFK